jgi:hypothetical protein
MSRRSLTAGFYQLLGFHEAFDRLCSRSSRYGRLLSGRRNDRVYKQLRQRDLSELQFKGVGPMCGGVQEM